MKSLKKVKNEFKCSQIEEFLEPKRVLISSFICENESPFNVLVKRGDYVKINNEILENKDGQKILSSISGIVTDVSLKQNYKGELSYFIEIENDKIYATEKLKKTNVVTKEDLIKLVKNKGVISKNFLIYKYFEKLNKTLKICAYDDNLIHNNYAILENNFVELKTAIDKIVELFNIEKIEIYANKNYKEKVKNLSVKTKKIFKKKPRENTLNLEDLLNIYSVISGKPQTELIVSVTGGAINKNAVLKIKNGTILQEIIDFLGDFKENYEDIENYKYTAMLALNDEFILEDKIKNCKSEIDKNKLIKTLEEKRKEAKENIFNKRQFYYEKFLDCLSFSGLQEKDKLIPMKDYNFAINSNVYGVYLLNNKQF